MRYRAVVPAVLFCGLSFVWSCAQPADISGSDGTGGSAGQSSGTGGSTTGSGDSSATAARPPPVIRPGKGARWPRPVPVVRRRPAARRRPVARRRPAARRPPAARQPRADVDRRHGGRPPRRRPGRRHVTGRNRAGRDGGDRRDARAASARPRAAARDTARAAAQARPPAAVQGSRRAAARASSTGGSWDRGRRQRRHLDRRHGRQLIDRQRRVRLDQLDRGGNDRAALHGPERFFLGRHHHGRGGAPDGPRRRHRQPQRRAGVVEGQRLHERHRRAPGRAHRGHRLRRHRLRQPQHRLDGVGDGPVEGVLPDAAGDLLRRAVELHQRRGPLPDAVAVREEHRAQLHRRQPGDRRSRRPTSARSTPC